MVDFLVIGPVNAVHYDQIFPFMCSGRIRFGMEFSRCHIFFKYGEKEIDVSGVSWFTTLDHKVKRVVDLKETYEEGKYKKIDGTDIINVDSIIDIPKDYPGVMAVPINFIDRVGDEYELVGAMGCGGKYNMMNPVVDGKNIYARILIQKISG